MSLEEITEKSIGTTQRYEPRWQPDPRAKFVTCLEWDPRRGLPEDLAAGIILVVSHLRIDNWHELWTIDREVLPDFWKYYDSLYPVSTRLFHVPNGLFHVPNGASFVITDLNY